MVPGCASFGHFESSPFQSSPPVHSSHSQASPPVQSSLVHQSDCRRPSCGVWHSDCREPNRVRSVPFPFPVPYPADPPIKREGRYARLQVFRNVLSPPPPLCTTCPPSTDDDDGLLNTQGGEIPETAPRSRYTDIVA